METAARGEYLTLLKRLLDDPRVAFDHFQPQVFPPGLLWFHRSEPLPLATAIQYKSLNSLKMLLHPRYPVTSNDIFNDVLRGPFKSFEMVVNHPRFDPSVFDNAFIVWTAREGFAEKVKILLTLPSVDPTAQNSAAFSFAVSSSSFDIIELFLDDGRVDPTLSDNDLFYRCITAKRADLVFRLLKHPKVKSSDLSKALVLAVHINEFEYVRAILFASQLSFLSFSQYLPIRLALQLKRIDMAEYLLENFRSLSLNLRCLFFIFCFPKRVLTVVRAGHQ
jgi:hypothetical protein